MELVIKKNQATWITFPIVKDDGTWISGAAGLDSEYVGYSDTGEPGAFADCTNEASEISGGIYKLELAQGETNYDKIDIKITSTTADSLDQLIKIRTTDNDPHDNPTATALATVDSNVDAILVDTSTTLPATLTTIEGKIDTVDSNVDAILVDTSTTLDVMLKRILGLVGSNVCVDYTFTGDDNTSASIYVYDTKANATTHNKSDGLLYEYSMSCSFSSNKPTTSKRLKES